MGLMRSKGINKETTGGKKPIEIKRLIQRTIQ